VAVVAVGVVEVIAMVGGKEIAVVIADIVRRPARIRVPRMIEKF
jgi:hypothetical protein